MLFAESSGVTRYPPLTSKWLRHTTTRPKSYKTQTKTNTCSKLLIINILYYDSTSFIEQLAWVINRKTNPVIDFCEEHNLSYLDSFSKKINNWRHFRQLESELVSTTQVDGKSFILESLLTIRTRAPSGCMLVSSDDPQVRDPLGKGQLAGGPPELASATEVSLTRGPAPIVNHLLSGQTQGGSSLIEMDPLSFDTGRVLMQRSVDICKSIQQ